MFRIAYGGANWVIAPVVLAILMVAAAGPLQAPYLVPLSAVPFFVATTFLWFFRDPPRPVAKGVCSPADGKVVRIDSIEDPELGACDRISIFMRVHDVHVNRFPFSGSVRRVTHFPGKHVPAFSKDSDRNERVETLLRTEGGDVRIVQIAGAVARRIVPYAQPGDHVEKGNKLGLIRLGSRCDLLVPKGRVQWIVPVGARVHAGRSQIATMLEGPR